jgi:hypothetical protein
MSENLIHIIGDLPYAIGRVVELIINSAAETPAQRTKSLTKARDILNEKLNGHATPAKTLKPKKPVQVDIEDDLAPSSPKKKAKPSSKEDAPKKKVKRVTPEVVASPDFEDEEPDFSDLDEDLDDAGL